MHTIIYGPHSHKNTFTANEMATGKSTVVLDGKIIDPQGPFINFAFSEVSEETDIIIIDNVPYEKALLVMEYFFNGQIPIEKRGQKKRYIKCPKVIITIQKSHFTLTGSSFIARFEVIRAKKHFKQIPF